MKNHKHTYLFFAISFFLLSFTFLTDRPSRNEIRDSNPKNLQFVTSKKMNINNIYTWFRNNGSFNRDPSTGNSGFEWPRGMSKFSRYASGLWLGGKVGNDTLMAIAEFDYEYLPGYIDDNGDPQGTNDPNYRIYSFSDFDTVDYGEWRTIASQQGAYLNSNGNPFKMGSQTMFYCNSDGEPSAHGNNAGSTAPLKAQILHTNWAYNIGNLKDVIFTEYRIINRNNLAWNNFYLSLWTDDDLGNSIDDAVGVDTASDYNLGFTYNFTNNDTEYGAGPPAVGTTLLKGPLVSSTGDTARYYSPPGSSNLIVKPNMNEIKLSSFNMYTNGDPSIGDPGNYRETYLNLQGLKRDGTTWINPQTNQSSKFPYSGSPENSSGWNETSMGDRRSLMTMGPINMQPGDTQTIIFAQVIARHTTNLNSITKLRQLTYYVNEVYRNNFSTVIGITNYSNEIPEKFDLHQNYPNPFNPSTKIKFDIPSIINQHSDNVKLSVYNSLGKEVKVLINEKLQSGSYEVEFIAENYSSGVYFYRLESDGFVQTKRMVLLK